MEGLPRHARNKRKTLAKWECAAGAPRDARTHFARLRGVGRGYLSRLVWRPARRRSWPRALRGPNIASPSFRGKDRERRGGATRDGRAREQTERTTVGAGR